MRKLIVVTLFLILIPSIVLAITWPSRNIIADIQNALAGNPIWPYDNLRNVFFYVFLPFWGSFAIFYGLLVQLRIFKLKKVNLLLALVFSMSMLYYGALTYIVSLFYTFGGFVTVIAFFVVFIVGVFWFGKKKEGGWRQDAENAAGISKEIISARKLLKEKEDELRIVREDLTDTRSQTRIVQLKEREKRLLLTIDNLRKQIVEMKSKEETIRTSLITEDDS